MQMKANEIKTKITRYLSRISIPVILVTGIFLLSLTPFIRAAELRLDPSYDLEISQLNQQINDKRNAAQELQKQVEIYKKSLASKQNEIATLSYQVSTLNQTITKISLEREALELTIEETNLQIQNAQLKIQATEEQIATQKGHLAELVRALYRSDRQNNIVQILATSQSLSDYFELLQNLQSVQDSVMGGLDDLGNLKIALVGHNDELNQNKQQLVQLNAQLDAKSQDLADQKATKYDLILDTKGQESKYQQLLQNLRSEQDKINSDIINLEQVAREQLNRQLQPGSKDLGSGPFIWPIGSQVITAYFHDPDYPYRNVFEHPAIDIRTPQGTAIHAASSGYVARAKDAGMGYSYIMLIHDNGLSTVYGHVSGISVIEGTFVTQGQIIGLSGGTPKTPGAGSLTTGPHLHFEVRLNGIPVNPLNYLPQ